MMTRTSYSNFTQHQKILMLMCRFIDKKWWFAKDFQLPEQGELFVGYEATARLAEMGKLYPEMIESQHEGKFVKRRLRVEDVGLWLPDLPKDLRYVVHKSGLKAAPSEPNIEPPQVEPEQTMEVSAIFKGRPDNFSRIVKLTVGQTYSIKIGRLQIGQPVKVTLPIGNNVAPLHQIYHDIKAFQKDWKAV